jgi:hypothetical protein
MITTEAMTKRKRSVHYVNNRDFLDALVVYKRDCAQAKEENTDRPIIPRYIGECFMKIATHYAYKPNFANYCVDSSTEALTDRGWLNYAEIRITDKILSYDQESKKLMWSNIIDIFINENYSGKMHHLTNHGLDMFVTPGHRVLLQDKGLTPVEKIEQYDSIILNVNQTVLLSECTVNILNHYEGVIWCPTTEYGSFMCRRNGRVYLTGNSYKEDLISDSVENMSRYVLNFDPEKSTNPFAYFTQITHFAFLRRIKTEKKETEKKAMIIERLNFDDVMFDDGDFTDNYSDYSSIKDNVYLRTRI